MDSPYSHCMKDLDVFQDELSKDASVYEPQKPAQEIFRLERVQIFFISLDGRVSTFSEPSDLRIYQFQEPSSDEEWHPVFIQAGGWTHPLIPGASPVLEASNGTLMFPDVYAQEGTASVGILLPEETAPEVRSQLITILEQHTALKHNPFVQEEFANLGKVGKALLKSAELLSKGIEKGAEKASLLIDNYGEKQTGNLSVQDTENSGKVNPALKVTAKGAKLASTATVKVSGFVANRVSKLSKKLASHLAKQATPSSLTQHGSDSDMKNSSSYQTLVDAARGGLLAYGTVYNTLEESAKVLGSSLQTNSVKVVQSKYGTESADVFNDSMTAAGNAAMTYMNVQSLGVKGLVKKTAKETGKEIGKNVVLGQSTGPKDN
ncbi:spartin [Lepeophtheirus salmonis]|uniref:spartin n=1 Tax=Lepeophtheirus salmonis TaxID=72036 RepID=UPI001AE2FD5F|nr:protein spartin-like [Lepeophtheirus salmonis]